MFLRGRGAFCLADVSFVQLEADLVINMGRDFLCWCDKHSYNTHNIIIGHV
jgi:hypothetical protein